MLIFLHDKIINPLEQKEECIATIREMVALAEFCRSKMSKLSNLDNYKPQINSFFLTDGIGMIRDNIDFTIIYNIMSNYIYLSNMSKAETNINWLILQGIVLIRDGHTPYIVKKILLSILGMETAEAYLNKQEGLI